jgi:AraC-like DNA-binding protein
MYNFFDAIKSNDQYRKLAVNDLLFVQYTCLIEESHLSIWSDKNYFAFITSGKKVWKTTYHDYEVDKGDIIFVKKGANLTEQIGHSNFCAILIFIPDDFIRQFLKKHGIIGSLSGADLSYQDSVIRVQGNELLHNYAYSVASYLSLSSKPNEALLMLKFEELLLNLFANNENRTLTDYFLSLRQSQRNHMKNVMEDNFSYNLKLRDYAKLCHMSLSGFKNAFKLYFGTSPALWLRNRKIEHAYQEVLTTNASISQIAFDCGFEDTSHFIRVFKQKFNTTPFQMRLRQVKQVNTKAA